MYNFRDEDEIKRDMLVNVKNTVDRSENSIVHDALSPAAIEFQNAYVELDYVAGKIDIENLEASELERFIAPRTGNEVRRKLATKATTKVTIRGNEGAVVKEGDLVSSEDILFVIKENKRIDESGVIEVLVECKVEGSSGNVPAHAINNFPNSIGGINTVTNYEEVTNGYENETDNELRERYYERVRRPRTSGNKYHFLNWAKEVKGVGNAKIIPLWNGNGTVKVVLIDSNKQLADQDLIDSVFNHIEEKKPVCGGTLTVVSAKSKNIDIKAKIKIAEGYTIQRVQRDLEDSIEEYRQNIVFEETYISHAAIGNIIFNTTGVIDYSNLKLNNLVQNIPLGDEDIPIFTTVLELML